MTEKQKIFTNQYVDKLYKDIQQGNSLMDYLEEELEVSADDTLVSRVDVSETLPELNPTAEGDAESAIQIYEYLGDLNNTQASDPRFWTYLAHITFREYTMKRYELNEDMKTQEFISSVKEHWFVGENDRSLRRHTIARLWWASKLTVSPWGKDAENFGHLENDDPYIYTRILLSNQDIYQSILERTLGRSSKILIAFLEYLNQNPEFRVRSAYRNLIKEINLISGFKKITMLPFDEIYKILEDSAMDII